MEDQSCSIIGAGAGQLEGNQTFLVCRPILVVILHIYAVTFQLEDDTVAAHNIAVVCLAGLHSHLERLHGSGSDHRIPLVTLGILQSVQLFNIVHQLLLIVFGSEVVECTLKDTLFHNLTGLHQANNAIAVDDHSGGRSCIVDDILPAAVHLCHGEGVTLFLTELGNLFGRLRGLGIDSNHFQLILIQLVGSLQIRELLLAGAAVDVPEVQHHSILFLQQFGQLQLVAFGIGDGEIGHNITDLVSTVRHIAFGDHGGSQHHIHLGAGDGIILLHIIAGGYAVQHQNVVIAAGCGEVDHAFTLQLAPGQNFVLLQRIVHIVVHVIQHHTAGSLHAQGVDCFRRLRSGGGRLRGLGVLTGSQHHAQAHQSAQHAQDPTHFIFISHIHSRSHR